MKFTKTKKFLNSLRLVKFFNISYLSWILTVDLDKFKINGVLKYNVICIKQIM